MKHKNLIVGGLVTASLLGGSAFAINASAQSSGSDTLASKIATKFNLNKDDVQKVIEESHTERHEQMRENMQSRLEERLTQAVTDGKLSEEQKTKILDYMKSQEGFHDSLEDKTAEERRAAIDAHREEVKKWAQDNGIDEQYVMFGGGHGHGQHKERMRGENQ